MDVKSMLDLQLAEVEMLTSMYSNPGELVLDDEEAVNMVSMLVNDEITYDLLESRIGFTLKLLLNKVRMSVSVSEFTMWHCIC